LLQALQHSLAGFIADESLNQRIAVVLFHFQTVYFSSKIIVLCPLVLLVSAFLLRYQAPLAGSLVVALGRSSVNGRACFGITIDARYIDAVKSLRMTVSWLYSFLGTDTARSQYRHATSIASFGDLVVLSAANVALHIQLRVLLFPQSFMCRSVY
jgi:hypothetical protein